MTWLLEPLQVEAFNRALLGVGIIAVLCGVIGAFVILRGLSYIGDAMAHAVFPGIVASFLLNIDYYIGGLIAAILTSLGIGWVSRRSNLKQDAAIGTVFVGMFALGIVLLSSSSSPDLDLEHLLVGDPLGMNASDILTTALFTFFILGVLFVIRKELVLVAFDEIEARVLGLPVEHLNAFLLILIALTVVLSIQMVGTVLVVSMLVTAASTARMLTQRLGAMMLLGSLIGLLGGTVGLYTSYYLNVPTGAMIVLVNTTLFMLVLLLKKQRP
jgi:manganese/iron transport system permease protein